MTNLCESPPLIPGSKFAKAIEAGVDFTEENYCTGCPDCGENCDGCGIPFGTGIGRKTNYIVGADLGEHIGIGTHSILTPFELCVNCVNRAV